MRRYVILAAALSLAVLGGCAADPDPASGSGIGVVATTTQVGSIAAEVGGDDIELTVLLSPGVEAHDYEMTPSAAAAIEDSELVLRSGAGLESWLDEALATIGGEANLRDMSVGIDLLEPAGPQDEDGHEEEERAVDPHYWLDATRAIRMVENVRDALIDASPTDEPAFMERAAELIARLETADAEIKALIGEIPAADRAIVTNHDALGYFIDAYGLRFVGSIFPSLDVASEPSAGELAALIETIRGEDVRAIFSESAVNPDLARAIAAETDAAVVEDPLYTDALGPPGSGAETLDGMLLHNARVIHEALTGA